MSLIPRNSLFDFNDFFDVFQAPATAEGRANNLFSPRVDIKDKKDHYEIVADLPGVDRDKLSVTLENGVLTIEANTAEEKTEEDEGRIIRRERRTGKYVRSFTLGDDVKGSDIKADFKSGVLTLRAPKMQAVESKKVEIAVK